MKIKIYYDVYNISKRVKDIDKNYYVVYNTSKNKFEIHHTKQFGTSYCLTVPFSQLDERTLKYVRQTQSTNIDEILDRIENDNKTRESANINSAFSKTLDCLEQDLL